MKKTVLTFGIISGLIVSLMFVVTIPFKDSIGFEKGMIIGYASMLAASLLIYFGVRSYRDNVANGRISFGRAFGVGMLIVAVSGVLYVATWEIVYPLYMPDFYEKYAEHQVEAARARGATPEQLEALQAKTTTDVAMYKQPVMNALVTFLEPLPVGLVVALISAWALSRRRKQEMPVTAVA
jgi:hypothetical protein